MAKKIKGKLTTGYEVIRDGYGYSTRSPQERDIILRAITPFSTGGGGSVQQRAEELEKQRTIQEAQRKAEQLRARAETEKKASEQRRLQLLAYRQDVRARSLQRGISPAVAERQLRGTEARALRETARERGISITTPTRERGFLGQMKAEREVLEEMEKPKETPYIETRYTGIDVVKGKSVPTYETWYVEPTKDIERLATKEEAELLRSQTNVLQASSKPYSKIQKAKDIFSRGYDKYLEAEYEIGTRTVQPITKTLKVKEVLSFGTDVGSVGLFGKSKEQKEFEKGITLGMLRDIETKPLKQVALIGIGGGISYGARGVTATATAIPKAGKYTGGITRGAVTLGGLGLTGLYAKDVSKKFLEEPTIKGKGGVLGVSLKDISLLGAGGYLGDKAFAKTMGELTTIGRTEIPTKKLVPEDVLSGKHTFPLAKQDKHLSLFLKQEYNLPITKLKGYTGEGELVYPKEYKKLPFKVKPSMHHATPEKFWKQSFEVSKGSSELGGLYGAHGISPYFLKTSGEYKWLPSFKDLFKGEGVPAVATITPKKFRVRGFTWKSKPTFEGQRAVGGKYAKMIGKDILGYADIPKMKSEVEAILPPTTPLTKVGKEFYFEWKGTKTPIDVFVTEPKGIGKVKGLRKGKGLKYSDLDYYYSKPAKSSILKPELSLTSYRKSYKPSSVYSLKSSAKGYSSKISSSIYSYLKSSKLSPKSYLVSSKKSTYSYKPSIKSAYSYKLPSDIIYPFPVPSLKGKKLKPKKRKGRGREDIGISETFAERQLGLKPFSTGFKTRLPTREFLPLRERYYGKKGRKSSSLSFSRMFNIPQPKTWKMRTPSLIPKNLLTFDKLFSVSRVKKKKFLM